MCSEFNHLIFTRDAGNEITALHKICDLIGLREDDGRDAGEIRQTTEVVALMRANLNAFTN